MGLLCGVRPAPERPFPTPGSPRAGPAFSHCPDGPPRPRGAGPDALGECGAGTPKLAQFRLGLQAQIKGGKEAVRLPRNWGTSQSGGPRGTGWGQSGFDSWPAAPAGAKRWGGGVHRALCAATSVQNVHDTGLTELVMFELGLEHEFAGSGGRTWIFRQGELQVQGHRSEQRKGLDS